MGQAEKSAYASRTTDAVRRRAGTGHEQALRPPALAGVTSPGMSPVQRIQRCAGNHAAQQVLTAEGDGRLHRCGPVPCNCSPEERLAEEGLAKARYDGLPVSHPAEPAEREADAVADQVMRMQDDDVAVHIHPVAHGAVRRCAEDGADAPLGAGGDVAPEAGPHIGLAAGIAQRVRGGGQPLDSGVRRFMQARFGRDLGPVQVHTDAQAGRLARQAGADAFTVGRHVFFAPGRYRPDDHTGRRLLAHELTHVVQQNAAGLATPAKVHRQAPSSSQPPAQPAPVPAEKRSELLEQAYRALGDHRRAAAIRACRLHGGDRCTLVLTATEVRNLYQLAQQSGGDQQKIRDGLPAAAPYALGLAVPAMAPQYVPAAVPGPPVSTGPTLSLVPPGASPPVGTLPGPPVSTPPTLTVVPPGATPPVATPPVGAPAAEVATGEFAGAEFAGAEFAGGAGLSATALTIAAAAAVTVLVAACALVVYQAWKFSRFQQELEAQGFVVLEDALGKCISGLCHSAQPSAPHFPDFDTPPLRPFDVPLRPLPKFPFPGRPLRPWPDIEMGRGREGRRANPAPQTNIDPRTDEPYKPKDPCDISDFHSCEDDDLTKAEAEKVVSLLPGFPGRLSGQQAVTDGACWRDGLPRPREVARAQRATHETWNELNGDKIATIKCCPCCIWGGTGVTDVRCRVIF